jgi:aminoglycoside 3-N-acetyltransferase
MTSFRELTTALRRLEIPHGSPVIAHASLSAFGFIPGGAETLLGALLAVFPSIMMPAFTYHTMLTPEIGPEDNGITYGGGWSSNRMAEFFRPDMPADRLMGAVPEALRRHPEARRSMHPILSFTGIHVDDALNNQTITQPLAPIAHLVQSGGWVLLLGVDHTVNTSIHYAEQLSRQQRFIRWALTSAGVVECPNFPGCSDGFGVLAAELNNVRRQEKAGEGLIQAFPLPSLIITARQRLAADPLSLLCRNGYCERCAAVRQSYNPGR